MGFAETVDMIFVTVLEGLLSAPVKVVIACISVVQAVAIMEGRSMVRHVRFVIVVATLLWILTT